MLWMKTKQRTINCHARCKYDWTSEIKPLVIGRSKNPRCFKGAKSLEVDYDFNKKSWMTSEICEKWVQKLDKRMIAECLKIALVSDNCRAHPKEINQKLNIVIVFLLATKHYIKTAANGSRSDKKNFKMHYRKRIVRKVITSLENNQSMPKIILRESISEISKAWNYDVTDRTILNSFAKDGFFVSNENSASTENKDDIPFKRNLKKCGFSYGKKKQINDDVLIDDFLSLDSEAETSETLTELDILNSVKNKNNTAMNCDEDEDDEDGNDHDAEINKPSYDEMLKSFETIRRGLQFEENTPEGDFGAL
ncbi:Tigger transposable element-derived protein 4 [Araneus ventricosus]|uniref:Tigger transposable element-derived protein 4 n=1 Tax=Araneus ventricosus TaxID=182803 RepID=A0A4Y2EYU8_ARAVE|nr:Tigger transposable element-derived protein 4 [Araneus ventricosus]